MRPAVAIAGVVLLFGIGAALAVPYPDDPLPRLPDSMRRTQLQANLALFRRLPSDVQERLRTLDNAWNHDEDAATKARLWGVMERYAGWLSRLPDDERKKIEQVPAGPERLERVRDMLERQWLAGLPKAYREKLADTPNDERSALLEKWKVEDRSRRRERLADLRRIEEGALPAMFDNKFYDDVLKWVKSTLEPKLNAREKKRLTDVPKNQRGNYLFQVLMLSEKHGATPPGPPEVWQRIKQTRRVVGPQ